MQNEKTYILKNLFSRQGGCMEDSSQKIESINPIDLIGPLNDIEQKYVPSEFFIAGNKELLQETRRISVIGTRNPSTRGIEQTQKIVAFLVKNAVVIHVCCKSKAY